MDSTVYVEVRRADGCTDTVRREAATVEKNDDADALIASCLSFALEGTSSTPLVVLARAIADLDEREVSPNMTDSARALSDAARAYIQAWDNKEVGCIGRTTTP